MRLSWTMRATSCSMLPGRLRSFTSRRRTGDVAGPSSTLTNLRPFLSLRPRYRYIFAIERPENLFEKDSVINVGWPELVEELMEGIGPQLGFLVVWSVHGCCSTALCENQRQILHWLFRQVKRIPRSTIIAPSQHRERVAGHPDLYSLHG